MAAGSPLIVMSFRIDRELAQRLREHKDATGINSSEFAREAFTSLLNEHDARTAKKKRAASR